MNKFYFKLLLFIPPVILLIIIQSALYYNADPYNDFTSMEKYSWKYSFQQLGDISTKNLLRSKVKDYNSFVFGSSRSTGAYACYLNSKIEGSNFFHYANWNETIGGIYQKLKLIHKIGHKIDNTIIYIDSDFTFAGNGKCSPLEHYLLLDENKYSYYLKHYFSFFSILGIDKLKILLDTEVNGVVYPNWNSDPTTNDHNHICSESIIKQYGVIEDEKTYNHLIDSLRKNNLAFNRSDEETISNIQISKSEQTMLLKIKQLFDQHQTNFKIVITPLYDQKTLHPDDIKVINAIFETNVYNFSGKNKITNDIYNYTDPLHFNKKISRYILDSIIPRE